VNSVTIVSRNNCYNTGVIHVVVQVFLEVQPAARLGSVELFLDQCIIIFSSGRVHYEDHNGIFSQTGTQYRDY